MSDPEEDEDGPSWHIGAPMMPRLAEELGRVVALWSRLEHMMNGAICQMCGIGLNLGDVFLNNVNMPARHLILDGVATRYLKDKDPRLCTALIKCSEKIRAYNTRNHLVHGLWQGTGFTGAGLEFATTHHTARKKHKRETVTWTQKDMERVGNEISDLIMSFWACVEELDEIFPQPPPEHKPWRRKPPLQPSQTLKRLMRRR
jgi:hypothetical protein